MTKVFHAGAIPGSDPAENVVSIYEGGDDLPLENPASHMHRMYFDSRFDYINLVRTITASVSMQFEQVTQNCGKKGKDCSAIVRSGHRSYTIAQHGQSYTPAIIVYDTTNNRALTGSQFIQTVDNTSFRLCHVTVDGTNIIIRERWFVRFNALPAYDVNYKIYVLNKPAV